ncbi:TonB-dependent siderophore receptor [Nitrosovibrio tenuis]|uniref:TonB-dependent siderophore receptor n=1 Tax=Nitrosovibrio tenuis TaxID=1233 RepID=UPI00115FC361|nr:TonB-dependent siderophore receptor [Nitrosovibrio tenuis]
MRALAAFHGILICLGTIFMTSAYDARAESASAADTAVQSFNILPSPLEDTLNRFAQQTGITLSFNAAEIKGLMTQGLQGDFTVQAGLNQLPIGSGLQAVPQANGYAIKRTQESTASAPSGTASSSGVPVLPPLVVSASKGRDYAVAQSVTATKTNTLLRDVPQAITVVTQDLIKDQGMLSMADVVRYVPGVGMAQGEGNTDAPIFRGNQSTGNFFVDGIRDDVEYFRDLYNIERVETLKGPNGMIFGRGGAGGVINRVSKVAGWDPIRSFSFQAGSFGTKRLLMDVGQGLNDVAAFRVNAMYENSGSYRDGVHLSRHGINPTLTLKPTDRTNITMGGEYFRDDRVADRGIPSFMGRPIDTSTSTFFGDPRRSPTGTTVLSLYSLIEHGFDNGVTFRNRTRYAVYDKFYQNIFPSTVSPDGTMVDLGAYNSSMKRSNVFNQSDLMYTLNTGPLEHRLLAGIEVGQQITNNLRKTGYFNNDVFSGTDHPDDPEDDALFSSVSVPVINPRTADPVSFRLDPTGVSNRITANIIGLYVQNQLKWSKFQAILGLRYDDFELKLHNNRTGEELSKTNGLLSPRAGLVFKPIEPVSIYWSYSLAYVPRAGDQLSSLEITNQALTPERFINLEAGVKWDIRPNLAVTAAAYRLDRTNVAIPDPVNPVRLLLANAQRSEGIELGISGRITSTWSVMGGYAYQDSRITRSQGEGGEAGSVLAQVPRHTFSLWNRLDITPWWG